MKKSFLLLLVLAASSVANAKIVLPQLFQSGMVLQRGKAIPVWGKADPQEQVTVRWQKKQYTTAADEQGRWRIDLPKTKAGGPYVLEVSGKD
jgi:sialate O-acetylesterase